MNAERLLALYEKVAEAPDAVPRLRRFVLDLAVRGKLVPQDAGDEPVAGHLRRIEAASEITRECPASWACVPLGKILDFKYGKGMKASERLEEGPVPVFGSNGVVGYTTTPLTDQPAIIIGRKGSAGALNLCNGPSWTTDVAYFVEAPSFLDLQYLFLALQTLELDTLGKGVKPGLSRADAYPLAVLIPPLAEQRRIVAKVEELMALVDRLEAARQQREAARDRLTAASLARLSAPDADPAEFPANARFALATLPALTTRPDQIKPLRQTILNLAVRGKLVPQDAGDEPASELLKRIAAEKARLVKTGEIRKPKALPPVEDGPFDLPSNWRWVRIREVTSDRGQRIPDGDFTYIDVTAINKEAGVVAEPNVLSKDEAPSRARKIASRGDVLYSCVRPYLLNVAVLDRDFDPPPIASTAFAVLNGHGLVLPWYLWIALRSPFMVECVEENQRGQAYPAINDKDFSVLPFPLPPLAEQRRIVAKVEELMALLDRLEAALATADTARARLLEALLHETLDPAAEAVTEAAE